MNKKFFYGFIAIILIAMGILIYDAIKIEKRINSLESIIIDDNQVLGSIFDRRSAEAIEQNILSKKAQSTEKSTFEFQEWLTLGPDKYLLAGWDDQTMEKQLENIDQTFKQLIKEFKQKFGSKAALTYREKSLLSLIGKLKLKNKVGEEGLTLKKVGDLGGIRLIFHCFDEIDPVLKEIYKDYKVIEEQDYFADPKQSGYRSYHLLVSYENLIAEIQLRTLGIELWSDWNHDLLYKNSDRLLALVGKEKLDEFNAYSKQLIDYIFNYEQGTPIPLPNPPEGISILWKIASDEAKKTMTPEGIPNLKLLPETTCKAANK